MSNTVQFKLNRAGVRQIMRSPEMMNVCKGYADRAVERLRDGYKVSTYIGKSRVNASVMAVTYQARKDNSENNTILKAVR